MRYKGFSLLELMIVVAIIAILAAIAYPSYQSYLNRGYRTDAKTQIMNELQAQSRIFAQNLAYVPNAAIDLTNNPNYTNITSVCVPADCSGIRVTANAVAGADPQCGSLSETNTGIRTAAVAANSDDCWSN